MYLSYSNQSTLVAASEFAQINCIFTTGTPSVATSVKISSISGYISSEKVELENFASESDSIEFRMLELLDFRKIVEIDLISVY